jgi:hypothetical protein
MSGNDFFDKLKKKAGEVLGHPYVRQASVLGEEILNITSSLAHNRNPLSIGSAVMAGANVLADALNIEFTNPINFYAKKHNLTVHNGELHALLINAGATATFPVSTVLKFDTMNMIRMTFKEGSSMYWVHQSSQVKQYDMYSDNEEVVNQYWLSHDFDPEAIHDFFWGKYVTGINLSYGKKANDFNIQIEISPLPGANQYAEMSDYSISEMVSYIRLSKSLGISRSFLLHGKPGTGKTSWTERIAQDFNNRIVKVDTSFLETVNNKEIEQILSILKPEIVLFDDFDRVDFDEYEGKFLYITENLKRKYPSIAFFATVNNTEEMSEALLRPGRFDEKFEFSLPSADSCVDIMSSYCKSLGVNISDAEMREAMGKSRFTPAECKEAILRLMLRPSLKLKDVLNNLRGFHPEEEDDEDEDEGSATDSPSDTTALLSKTRRSKRKKTNAVGAKKSVAKGYKSDG